MIQRITQQFPQNNPVTTPGGATGGLCCLQDLVECPLSTPNQSQWTAGDTKLLQSSVDTSVISPSAPWSIQIISFTAYLGFESQASYGKLGKVYGGLLDPSVDLTQYPNPQFDSGILLPLPNDPALATKMWDADTDPMPPQVIPNASAPLPIGVDTLLPITGQVTLPVPKEVIAGQPITVGIWITPSLLGSPLLSTVAPHKILLHGLLIFLASFTLVYDDGTKAGR